MDPILVTHLRDRDVLRPGKFAWQVFHYTDPVWETLGFQSLGFQAPYARDKSGLHRFASSS
jgi:hypothetical protein